MELDHDFTSSAPRMPVSRMAQLGAMAMVVLIVLVVVFWNPTPAAPEGEGSTAAGSDTSTPFSVREDGASSAVVSSGGPEETPPLRTGAGSSTMLASTRGAGSTAGAGSNTGSVAVAVTGAGSGAGSTARSEPVRAAPTETRQPRPRPPVRPGTAPPGSRFHEVTDEDTLVRIAIRYYGRASAYRQIVEANRHQLRDPNRVPIGMRLIIPPSGATRAPVRTTSTAPPVAAPAGGGKHYVVQPGDSFIRLSRRFYGTSRRWRAIMEANKLPENGLRVGQRIVIPPK